MKCSTFTQLFVAAVDQGIPSRSATVDATVRITVTRNQNSPIFFNEPYAVTIRESESVGTSIYSVTVNDADTVVSDEASVCVCVCVCVRVCVCAG